MANFRFLKSSPAQSERENSEEGTLDESEKKKFNETFLNIMRAPHRSLFKSNAVKIPLFRDDFVKTKLWNEKKISNLDQPFEGFNFIDVGSGGGTTAEALAHLGANVTGIDVSENLITMSCEESAKDPKIGHKVKFICTTAEDHLVDYKNHYDALVCSFVIEHTNNKELLMKSCSDLVKPGGSLFFCSVNNTFLAWWRIQFLSQYVYGGLGRGSVQVRKNHVQPEVLRNWMESSGFKVQNSCGLYMDPQNCDWSIIPDLKGFYYMHAVKNEFF